MEKKFLFLLIFSTLFFSACDNAVEFDKYFLGEKFTVMLGKPVIVVDTSMQIFNDETKDWEYPEYLIEVKSFIKENRCPPNLCSVCFGGAVEIECSVTNVLNQMVKTSNVDYPSCTESDLSINGGRAKAITIDGIDFKCLAILPFYDLPESPSLKDYQLKFIGLK